MRLHIPCKEATFYISKREERKLTLVEWIELWLHLLVCEFCRMFLRQTKFISSQIKSLHWDEHLTEIELRSMEDAVTNQSR